MGQWGQSQANITTYSRAETIHTGPILTIMMYYDVISVTLDWKWRHSTVTIRVVVTGRSDVIAIYTACGWGTYVWKKWIYSWKKTK